jgi:NADH:ubiquinone oxidoreductase subunit F (NADH-binding)/(2Fe-2S) ferredoxin
MASSFAELKEKAQQHQAALEARPWIRVGTALCGQAAGALAVVAALQRELARRGIEATLSQVGCIGLCFAEPLVDIQAPGRPRVFYRNVKPAMVPELVEACLVKGEARPDLALGYLGQGPVNNIPPFADLPMWKHQVRIATRNCGTVDPGDIYQYIARGGYGALDKALSQMTPQQVLEEVTKSGLLGRGGAAFPTGTKWGFLARAKAPRKFILVNGEEGDPGAFNDKGILESDPHTVVEGAILAGYATGASYGYIFIRHGHQGPIERSRHAIEQARQVGLLGNNILGSSFSYDMEVALTGESYVAGEETGLMEAIEGKCSQPRFRPPFPAQAGLWQLPSNVNNVKTISYVPEIVMRGGDWYASIGHEKSKGTAVLCFSGAIKYPGMYELPFGMTVRQALHEVAGGPPEGKTIKLLQTGGPLGGVLGASNLDIVMDFEAMAAAGAILGSGGIIVGDASACAVDLTRNLVAFCQFESCGKCFPCRLGMTHILEVVERIARGEGRPGDLELVRTTGQAMASGSLCGHGQLGFNPVQSALRYFPEDFQVHMEERRCPTGACNRPFARPTRTRPTPSGGWYARRDYTHR